MGTTSISERQAEGDWSDEFDNCAAEIDKIYHNMRARELGLHVRLKDKGTINTIQAAISSSTFRQTAYAQAAFKGSILNATRMALTTCPNTIKRQNAQEALFRLESALPEPLVIQTLKGMRLSAIEYESMVHPTLLGTFSSIGLELAL